MILAVLVVGILLDQRENVTDYLADVGLVAALFCAASLVAGYVIPKALGIVEGQAIASSMEIGVHNATLAIFVAVEVLEATEISIPAAVYSLFMFVFAAAWGSFISRRVGAPADWLTSGRHPEHTDRRSRRQEDRRHRAARSPTAVPDPCQPVSRRPAAVQGADPRHRALEPAGHPQHDLVGGDEPDHDPPHHRLGVPRGARPVRAGLGFRQQRSR